VLTTVLSVFQYFVEQHFAKGVAGRSARTRSERLLSAVRTRRGVAR
jgi:polar amino acid transport system permease protein